MEAAVADRRRPHCRRTPHRIRARAPAAAPIADAPALCTPARGICLRSTGDNSCSAGRLRCSSPASCCSPQPAGEGRTRTAVR
eukprot:scaffold93818_cov62-Phaeocystis_antarctica.AAC.6